MQNLDLVYKRVWQLCGAAVAISVFLSLGQCYQHGRDIDRIEEVHEREIAALRLLLEERTRDRISSSEVHKLFEMHLEGPAHQGHELGGD